ncbi:hypothetical protein QYE76_041303 [Lolium multiflorum]|uniref:CCHC-type domain-containing protein n=1 Tax=Lolium multiflorum TaxID=4521 RepID=A0AAD8TDB9_LOLMU|nr:hypothetical protein QYE76_041303 [Lolium multiflorum]
MPPRREPEVPAYVQQMMEAQAQLMQAVTQTITQLNNNMQNNNNNNNPPPPPPRPHVDMLTRFLRLRPEKFSRAAEPMVANDWLRSVNKDLVTIGCTDAEKVRFAAHLLEGPAASWWENFQVTHPIAEVTWAIFEEGFRTAHISSGVMDLKRTEFLNLRQGHRSVSEYIEEFSNLARYAPDDSNTDAKRKERFLKGLNDELMVQLSVVYLPTYQSLCDKAITLEDTMKEVEKRKRKHSYDKHGSGPPHKMRSYGEGSGGSGYHKYGNNDGGSKHQHHNGNGHHHNGHKSYHHHNNSGKSNGNHHGNGNGHNNGNGHRFVKKDISQVECFKCRKTGHYANECPEKESEEARKAEEARKPNPFRKGHVNHVNVEELYDEPDAVIARSPPSDGAAIAGASSRRRLCPPAASDELRRCTSTTAPALVSSARIVPTAGKSAASRSAAHDDRDLFRAPIGTKYSSMSRRSGYTGEGRDSIMSLPGSTSPTSSEVQLARQADDPWYIAYQDESTQWCSQRMDLEEKVANLGDELARKNLMIFELKRIVEEEKKNSELIHKEKLRVETDLAVFDQVVENLEHELKVMGEEKSRFICAVLLGVIPVLAVMWFW